MARTKQTYRRRGRSTRSRSPLRRMAFTCAYCATEIDELRSKSNAPGFRQYCHECSLCDACGQEIINDDPNTPGGCSDCGGLFCGCCRARGSRGEICFNCVQSDPEDRIDVSTRVQMRDTRAETAIDSQQSDSDADATDDD
jgi:hypothetical protein